MPEMRFLVRWPDQSLSDCYSPSLVIKDFLVPGTRYPLADFVAQTRTALGIASDRVREKYGFACSAAADQQQEIERLAARFADDAEAMVTVESFVPE
ncbi:MAG: MSMEG_0570 family nitrogen starvation response protein [Janthinobacterium lividum]